MRQLSGWSKQKWNKAEVGFSRELLFTLAPKAEKAVQDAFIATQESFVRDLPEQETPTFPFITGNLHDSIVGVTSKNGRVVRASYTNPVAKTTSTTTGKSVYRTTSGMGRKRIIGSLYAFSAVKNMQGKYPGKLATSLWVTVPYALNPNEKGPHMGYLDNLRNNFAYAMESEFRRATYKAILQLKGSLDNYVQLSYDADDARIARRTYGKRGRKRGSRNSTMGAATPGMSMKLTP